MTAKVVNPKAPGAKVMTANLLREGEVVYLTDAGDWSLWIGEARVVHDEAGAAELDAGAQQGERARLVVGPYLMEVEESAAGPQPISTREIIRAKGPTVHPHFGKQAAAG